MQLEVLRRLRTGGQQLVRVEHVHINDGGQAAIGNVMVSDAASTDGKNSEPVKQSSGQPTMNKRSNSPMPVAGQPRLPPGRVKLPLFGRPHTLAGTDCGPLFRCLS
jgi:hypothetical protein